MFSLNYSMNTLKLSLFPFYLSSPRNRCYLYLRDSAYSFLVCIAGWCSVWAKMNTRDKPNLIWRKQINVPYISLQPMPQIISQCQILVCFQSLNVLYSPVQVVTCLGLYPTAVWFSYDLELSLQVYHLDRKTDAPRRSVFPVLLLWTLLVLVL